MFKFLHAADIHLDSPLRGLAAYEGAPVEALRGATRAAFRNLIDSAIQERVAFVVIAGDLYDGTWRDYQTGLFFVAEMGRLRAAGIPAYVLYGNHDAESEITRRLPLPDNVHPFPTSRAATFRLDHLKVALHGQSFRTAATIDNLVPAYPEPVPGWLNIGVLHTALEGSNTEHARYAPCSVQELAAKGYQYWALGHVHEHAVVERDPWIVFPGNLQGRHARETGARGAVLVTAGDDGVREVERIFPDVLRWRRLEVDLGAATTLDHAVDTVRLVIDQAVAEDADRRPLALRVVLAGETAVHGTLFENESSFTAEVRALAAAHAGDAAWIEKILIETTSVATTDVDADALGEFRAILEDVAADPVVLAALSQPLEAMLARLPPDLRTDDTPELAAIRDGRIATLASEMQAAVSAWVAKAR